MIWTIGAVILAIIMLVVLSRRVEDAEVDTDPVFQTVLDVDCLCDEIARWETNLWSLWAMAVVENLLMRLDELDRLPYLYKLENQIIELQVGVCKIGPMSEKGPVFPYFEQETIDLHTP